MQKLKKHEVTGYLQESQPDLRQTPLHDRCADISITQYSEQYAVGTRQ